ncbi:EscU/YscU/HrcU family type III secretion system export apparatus switch protein [Thermodesulfatator atlanticus]|uniref:EscU/YscU/HrcU family type III secretion system export apparatus switch protein n=1 Tax=Thermodesulfatator atlanticus TaxID=501497 RepID=UPI0003B3055B|nr:EscU/YscU/HrcU family type III secretion system export apparatus switch protein [Thermodesulfatator atlanticus]
MKKKAVALKYEPAKDKAPKVVAKGEGLLAEKIIELAKDHGIPIKEDQELIEALMKIELEREIPPELYEAVAIVLAWALRLNQES